MDKKTDVFKMCPVCGGIMKRCELFSSFEWRCPLPCLNIEPFNDKERSTGDSSPPTEE